MTNAERWTAYARKHYSNVFSADATPEEIGRALLRVSNAGPRMWTGLNLLRALGVLVEPTKPVRLS